MFFRLFNTSVISQKYINKILAKKFDIFVIIYLDNILIYTKDLRKTYVKIVYKILDKLQKHFFFANLKKCHFD